MMFTLKYFQFQLKSHGLAFLVFLVDDARFKNPCSIHRKFIDAKLTSQRAIPSSPLEIPTRFLIPYSPAVERTLSRGVEACIATRG